MPLSIGSVVALIFVFLWSTGYIGAKLVLPFVEPLTFLLYRFAGVCLLLLVPALMVRSAWPKGAMIYAHLVVAGLCNHAFYLGGVFVSVKLGMSASDVAMIVNLQPLLMVLVAMLLFGERMIARQWLGFALGWVGVALVVKRNSIAGGALAHVGPPMSAFIAAFIALMGIAIGTLYQRRFCGAVDLRVTNLVQYAACLLLYLPIVPFVETMQIQWDWRLVAGYAWFVLVLSIGAISLLYWLLRRGLTSQVAKLFFLVPPCTAVLAWWLFDERLGWVGISGMVCVAVAVYLARQAPATLAVSVPSKA
jgi:drug/metabolite transporter (DMT)-like permease